MLSSAGLFVGAPGKGKGLRRRRSTKSCLESASSGFSSAFDVFPIGGTLVKARLSGCCPTGSPRRPHERVSRCRNSYFTSGISRCPLRCNCGRPVRALVPRMSSLACEVDLGISVVRAPKRHPRAVPPINPSTPIRCMPEIGKSRNRRRGDTGCRRRLSILSAPALLLEVLIAYEHTAWRA